MASNEMTVQATERPSAQPGRSHALDRRHVVTLGLDRKHHAALDRRAVVVDGAGPAVPGVAADVRPGQAKVVQTSDGLIPADLLGRTRLLFDLTHLALQTDSTRLITIMLADEY